MNPYLKAQRLAFEAAQTVSQYLQEGWTEIQAAHLLNTYLRDCGVKSFFHEGFAWFGERTRFEGIKKYKDFMPSKRILLEGEAYILDVAPIVQGYCCDIGYPGSLGDHKEIKKATLFLKKLRDEIPALFLSCKTGSEIFEVIYKKIEEEGYDNVHCKYPFSVLGHRVHQVSDKVSFKVLNFGWQSYWSLLSRGLFGQLLNKNHKGNLSGLWAIEPHIGKNFFGAKFEEILVVEKNKAYWLEKGEPQWICTTKLSS